MPDRAEKRTRPVSSQSIDNYEEYNRSRKRAAESSMSLQEVRKHLRGAQTRTWDMKLFIPFPAIKGFWTVGDTLQDFLQGLDCSTSSIHAILTSSLRILTALVLVDWDTIERVREVIQGVFPKNQNPLFTDESLTDANSPIFQYKLFPNEQNFLDNTMDLVSVPVLVMSKHRKPFHEHTTLPITSKSEIGKGAFGKVYKIQIAEGCLMVKNFGDGASPNKLEDCFALKEMNEVAEGNRELEFLRQYRNNSRKSEHIMGHLAIIERGDQASVIYALATGDVQKLLEGDIESFRWCEEEAARFFCDIVQKSYNLADGLAFLHRQMRDYSSLTCRHGDLKPNNILVFSDAWKISDMGLARVKNTSIDESGVRRTTKTTSKDGCGPYAAPEMSVEGALIGRETDVWSLAAITTELIIWGFGGTVAWQDFVRRREQSSKGLFYQNNALSPAVDEELLSWAGVYRSELSKILNGDDTQASRFLQGLVEALRKALEIDPTKRTDSEAFVNSMAKVCKYLNNPMKKKLGMTISNELQMRIKPSLTVFESLNGRFNEHRQHPLFSKEHFKPTEQIRVSNETEHEIRKWIEQPTPSALCIVTGNGHGSMDISAITHEIYYAARRMNYYVVGFLSLNRYDRTVTPLRASLDFVYCIIFQLMNLVEAKPEDQLQRYNLDKLGMEDTRSSDDVKFDSAVNVLGQIIKTEYQDREGKPIIVIIDEFWQVCTRKPSGVARPQWAMLLTLLGCGKSNTSSPCMTPNFRVLIRSNGWFEDLRNLGFSGTMCSPSGKHDVLTLRDFLNPLLK